MNTDHPNPIPKKRLLFEKIHPRKVLFIGEIHRKELFWAPAIYTIDVQLVARPSLGITYTQRV